jgi:phage terminase large subunit GpA-like protein
MTTPTPPDERPDFSNPEGLERAVRRSFKNFEPPEKLLPSEWAERKVRISEGNALPGPMRFRNAPFQVEPLDMVVRKDVHTITLMWAAQTGKTMVQLCAIGFFIEHDPNSQIVMQPSEGDLKTWLSTKFDPMVSGSAAINDKIAGRRSKHGVNNTRMKQYPGGWLMFSWAGSPKTMRQRSAPKIFTDEIDGYDDTKEGDTLTLIEKRSATYGDDRLNFRTSTPLVKDTSKIEASFDDGDQRRWHVECAHCQHEQYLKWQNVLWQKDPDSGEHLPHTVGYACDSCGVLWTEPERITAIRAGRWIAEKPFRGHVSYHLPELASLLVSLADIVKEFLECHKKNDIQAFTNTALAETWDEGEKQNPEDIFQRRQEYPAPAPAWSSVLCAGVDTQDNRLEVSVWGFGGEVGQCAGLITHQVFHGDPGQIESKAGDEKTVWERLDEYLQTEFDHESGVRLRIAATGIDSGGHFTTEVYKFCKKNAGKRYYALKGSKEVAAPMVGRPTNRNTEKCELYPVGGHACKVKIYAALGITDPTDERFIHFPLGEPLVDQEYFNQLTAEKIVTTYRAGHPVKVFKQTRRRNEAIDCAQYARAAVEILRPNYRVIANKLSPATLKKKKKKTTPKPADAEDTYRDLTKKGRGRGHKSTRKRPGTGGFVSRW